MSVKSCTVLTVQCDGVEMMTIEGFAAGGELHALQEAFHVDHALQCGYCTPGMITRAYRLLKENPNPSEEEIRYWMAGNLCRCTGYQNIVKAVQYRREEARRRKPPPDRTSTGVTAMPDDKLEREQKLEGMGASRLRKEDARFIRGQGSYVDDIKLPGMLFGAIVRSPYAHARIKSIDKSAALKVPGVVAVLTADDLKPVKLHWMPTLGGDVQAVLADTKVCFQYQEVAFVLAQDRYAAADGADAVIVDYEELPAIVDPKKSMAKDAPIIREDIADKDNVGHGPRTHPNHIFTWDAGDKDGTDAVFANAPVTVREEILNPRVHPCPLETCGCVASFDKVRGQSDRLPHLAGAASRAHRRRDAVGHPGEQDPHRRRRHRRRLRQQGAGVSGLRRGDRRVDRHRCAGEVDRVADRQHLDHRLRARLSRRRRAGRGQGRAHQGAALYARSRTTARSIRTCRRPSCPPGCSASAPARTRFRRRIAASMRSTRTRRRAVSRTAARSASPRRST